MVLDEIQNNEREKDRKKIRVVYIRTYYNFSVFFFIYTRFHNQSNKIRNRMNRTKATTTTKSVKKRFKIALQTFSLLAYIAAILQLSVFILIGFSLCAILSLF